MKRGRIDSDTFIMQSDARIQDLDRELEILRQKRQIIQEQMTEKPYGAPYMPEPSRQQWNSQPFQNFQQPMNMVQYPIMSQLKQLMNPQQNTGQQFNQNQFNPNPPRRAPNPPRRPPLIGRQKSPPRRPNNPPRRQPNPPPRPARPTYTTTRPTNPPRRQTNPPPRQTNPPPRQTNPPMRSPNPPSNILGPRPKQRKRPRKPMEGPPPLMKSEPVTPVKPVQDSFKPGLIFRENEEPSNQVMGRLELALGMILKHIKSVYTRSPHDVVFTAEGVRYLKCEIRKRVHAALVGKYIGPIEKTMEEYRKMYPVYTDKEMVDSMKKYLVEHPHTPMSKQEENFRRYLKENYKTAVDKVIGEMLAKIKPLSIQEEGRLRSEVLEAVTQTGGEGDANAASGPSQSTADQSAADQSATDQSATDQSATDQSATDQPAADQPAADEIKGQADGDIERPPLLEFCLPHVKMTYYLIARTLSDAMENHKNKITKVLDVENLFEKLYEQKRKEELAGKKQRLVPPIYMKILGKPTLPPKKDTVLFLKRFNIVSLKKHTKLTNMLVAAVSTKEDFEAMKAANMTKLGNSILYIQRSKSRNDDNCDFGDCEVPEPTNGIVDNELDQQIDNLLTSIRNDEDDAANTDEPNAKKFKSADDEADYSNDVGVTGESDAAQVVNDAAADSTNIELSVDGYPTGFEVIDSVQEENDTQAAQEIDENENSSQKTGNVSLNDVEIVETAQDVITIDDEVEDSESRDVKPVVAAAVAGPRRSTRSVSKN